MIAETGVAALWLAASLAVVQLATAARPVAVAQAVLAAIGATAMIADIPAFYLMVSTALLAVGARGKLVRPFAALGLGAYAILILHVEGWPIALATLCLAAGSVALHRHSRSARRAPWWNIGLRIATIGAAILFIGVMSDRLFPQTAVANARPGDRLEVGPWLVELATVNPALGPDFTAIEAELRATRGSGVTVLKPQSRTAISSARESSEPAVETFWSGQLSATLKTGPRGSRIVRLQWRPLIVLAWLGGALIGLGGLIVLIGEWVRKWRRRPRPAGRYQ